jgi:hypothetical protein
MKRHPEKQALAFGDEHQVSALIREAWGDFGHMMVLVRRDDASPERKWSATIFDHENRPLATAHSSTRKGADEGVMEAIVDLGYSPTGYGSQAGKPKLPWEPIKARYDATIPS